MARAWKYVCMLCECLRVYVRVREWTYAGHVTGFLVLWAAVALVWRKLDLKAKVPSRGIYTWPFLARELLFSRLTHWIGACVCVCVYTSTHTYENEHKRTDINRQTHTETHIHRHTNARSNTVLCKNHYIKTLAYMNRKTLYRVDTTLAYICNSNKNNNKPVSSKLYVENGVLSN